MELTCDIMRVRAIAKVPAAGSDFIMIDYRYD